MSVAPPIPGLPQGDAVRCLSVMLAVSGWRGLPRDVLHALPHGVEAPDLADIRNALALLGRCTRPVTARGGRVDPRALPALLAPARGLLSVLYLDEDGTVLRYDGGEDRVRRRAGGRIRGRLYALTEAEAPDPREGWTERTLRRFRPEAPALLACSVMAALAGLGAPLFVMAAFNHVAGARAEGMLPLLLAGALGALLAEAGFRAFRQRLLNRIAERFDRLVAAGVFGQLLALPSTLVDGAGRAAQVSRIRDFSAVRDFLAGAFAVAVLDLPASLAVLALLAALGGWIALAPVLAAVGLAVVHLAMRGRIRRTAAAAARAGQVRDALALEALEAQRTLRLGGAEGRWARRYADAAAAAATASATAASAAGAAATAGQALVGAAALGSAVAGAAAVMAGAMSAGALIAGMMLIWRALGPLLAGFAMLSRWGQTRASIAQIDGMMSLATERSPPGRVLHEAPSRGAVEFQRVSLRHPGRSDPVLAGACFDLRPGEVVALTGAEGAGKTTLLRVIAGLAAPQSGAVKVDGRDVRAYEPAALRRAIAWVPQSPELIYGTVAQNLRLARPDADDAALRRAAREARVLDEIEALPAGFGTRLGDHGAGALPRSVLLRLTLARALLAEAPILLLDEPAGGMDDCASDALAAQIEALRGRTTILMATHRPSHVRLADRVLHLREGRVDELAPPACAPARAPVFARRGAA